MHKAVARRRLVAISVALAAWGSIAVVAQIVPPRPELQPIVGTDAVRAGSAARIALQVRLPQGAHVNSSKPRDPNLRATSLKLDVPAGVTVVETVYPEPQDLKQAGVDQPLSVFAGAFVIGVELRLPASLRPGQLSIPATLNYQACNESMCFAPTRAETSWTLKVVAPGARIAVQHPDVFEHIAFGRGDAPGTVTAAPAPSAAGSPTGTATPAETLGKLNEFTTLATTGGYMSSADFLRFLHNAENGVKEAGPFEGRGPLAILLLVFLGGLALNLTPCVLPMIPINLAIIGAGAHAGSRSRGLLLGATYGAAMTIVYGLLGLVVILTAGTFGTINASPWFNAGIAVLFVVLALAMFDVIVIDFSRFSTRFPVGQSGRGTLLVAFGMGAVAALLAGACVAPAVIQVVVLASSLYAAGTTAALALPFVLGLGMAIPWPIAGAGIASLPRPGAWMVRVKQLLGVVILATALYYGYEAYTLFANRWVDPSAVSASVEEQLKAGWHASVADGLATAEREGKPVLIDMWATWCKNCLVMDATTLKDPQVTSALANYVKIKFQAEDAADPLVEQVMKHFGAVGLPTYVVLRAK